MLLCKQSWNRTSSGFRQPLFHGARRTEISISPKGRALIRRAPQPIQQQLIGAIETLPSAARKRLSRSLGSVISAAGIADGPAPLFFEEHTK